jgi:hypothetical protein
MGGPATARAMFDEAHALIPADQQQAASLVKGSFTARGFVGILSTVGAGRRKPPLRGGWAVSSPGPI